MSSKKGGFIAEDDLSESENEFVAQAHESAAYPMEEAFAYRVEEFANVAQQFHCSLDAVIAKRKGL